MVGSRSKKTRCLNRKKRPVEAATVALLSAARQQPHLPMGTILKAIGRSFEAIEEHNKGVALGSDDDGGATEGIDWGLE
jgi:hypothetical protein